MSRQVYKNKTFHVRPDIGWKQILLMLRAETGKSMKTIVEEVLGDYYPNIEDILRGKK